jgi:hypothetical protein
MEGLGVAAGIAAILAGGTSVAQIWEKKKLFAQGS